jgi:hypothetical protein
MNTGGVVTFNWAEWIVQYPEFGFVTQPQGQSFFNRATLLVDNTACSPISDLFQRTILLNMATAHIAALFASQNGQGPRGVVGRISDSTEGSVSASLEYVAPTTDIAAYWNQTPYGAQYFAATRKYRTGFYAPAPRGVNGNQGFGFFGFGGFRRF